MNPFVILIPYFSIYFVHCVGEIFEAPENDTVELGEDPDDDDDAFNYDENENNWVNDAVINVAYYLRSQKFNGYDTRFFQDRPPPEKSNFYGKFVDPPLKYFHFEVFQNCQDDFIKCLRYLYETALDTYLQRSIDTIYVMRKNNLTLIDNAEEIRNIDKECNKLKNLDDRRCDPFDGPIERFQWSTTARYYMCWFTLWEKPQLAHFGEPCDNFASCLPDDEVLQNYDIRADDSIPFQCAFYSFCPDPCCADQKLLLSTDSCHRKGNPCRNSNNPKCSFNKTLNRSFVSMVYNEWNVSCICHTDGYRWNSRYGQCVDYNECRFKNTCDKQTENCVNYAGKFNCTCKVKFKWSEEEKKCIEDDVMIRAMKRFSGLPEESFSSKLNYFIYWVVGGLILIICALVVGILIYRSRHAFFA